MTLRSVVLLSAPVALAAVLLSTHPPLHDWYEAAIGRAGGCPPQQAWAIEAHHDELTRAKDQILERTVLLQKEYKGLELYSTPDGNYWAPGGSHYVLPFNLAEQAIQIYGKGPRAVQPGDIVLDCGANVGVFTRLALKAGAKQVIAIEPAPDNVECLRRNFAQEIADKRVILVPKGVWNKEDTLELLVDPDNQAADSFVIHREGAKAVARVPLTTIDRLVAEYQLPSVDYVKMDIEGAEVRALEGARATLQRFHPRMSLSVYHQPDHPVEVPRAARAAWPAYRVECGPCNAANGQVRPEILYFH